MTAVDLGFPRVPHTRGSFGAPRPDNPELVDTFGRVATDLRVSLTDRCNLRCTYCMPAEGLDWMPGDQVLGDDELMRLLRIAVERLGITDIRLTGGQEPRMEVKVEPRRGCKGICSGCGDACPGANLSMFRSGALP